MRISSHLLHPALAPLHALPAVLLDANAAVAVAVRINPVARPRRPDVPQRARRRGGPHAKRPRPAARRVARRLGEDVRHRHALHSRDGGTFGRHDRASRLAPLVGAVAATVAATGAIIFGAMYMPWVAVRRAVVAAHRRRRQRHACSCTPCAGAPRSARWTRRSVGADRDPPRHDGPSTSSRGRRRRTAAAAVRAVAHESPQSWQSVPSAHFAEIEPGPPSSQKPS